MTPAQIKVWEGKLNHFSGASFNEASVWAAENYQEDVCALGDVLSQVELSIQLGRRKL